VEWDETKGKWMFKVKNLETGEDMEDEAEYFINAGGVLNNYKASRFSNMSRTPSHD
jgi:hypothetical protein